MRIFEHKNVLLILILCVGFSACGSDGTKKKDSSAPKILAEVNGSKITSDDLSLYIESSVSREMADKMPADARKKALEGLVLSKIMAQTKEKKLAENEKALLERKVAAYREQQLVKMYMIEELPPAPVTKEMIEEYYRRNPEKFGASTIKRFEILGSETRFSGNDQAAIMDRLAALSKEKDWKKASLNQSDKTFRLYFKEGWSNSVTLEANLANLIRTLAVNNVSGVTFIDSKPCVLRIAEERKIQPKPLAEVEDGIRKSLLASQISAAVRNAKEGLFKGAQVKYMNE